MKRRAQSLIEFAFLAIPILIGAALLQSTMLPAITGLLSTITTTILSLRV